MTCVSITSARADEGEAAPRSHSDQGQALLSAPPTVEPTQELDQNFLLLPAYDLEWEKPPSQVRVGDTLIAKLQGGDVKRLPKDLKIKSPPGTPEETDLGFDIQDNVATSGEDLIVSIVATKAGNIALPSLALVDASGKAVARTNPVSFVAQSTISKDDPKAKEAEPPRPPVSLGFPLSTLVAIGILVLLLVGALVYAVIRWSRARRAAIPIVKEPPKPEHEVALAALEQLEKRGLMRSGQFKAHYFAISEILKHYIGARYEFDAAESTTDEMLSVLRERRLMPGKSEESLSEVFERLDRVKFTDHAPVSVEGMELLEEAKKFVLSTRRLPPIVNQASEVNHASS
jgi:hypothetical protein